MSTATKNVILKALIENEIVELMVKTNATNVMLDETTTLAAKLAEIITTLNTKATTDEMNSAISTAIGNLIGGAPETYDTLKEISDYISAHADVVSGLNAAIGNKVDKVAGKGLSTNDFTTALKNKLDAIAAGAEVNQNAFSNLKVGSTTIASGSKTATLELAAGANIELTPDATGKKVTIAAHDTTYDEATTSAAGLMSAADKAKLNGIATGANKTTVDSSMSATSTNPVQNKVIKAYADAKPTVHFAASQPSNLKAGDLWVCIE